MPEIRSVAVLVSSTARLFELAVYCEVFGVDRTGRGVPRFDFTFASERPGVEVDVFGGLRITPLAGLDYLADVDLVAVAPTVLPERDVSPEVAEALREADRRGARIVAVSSGAFVLAAAGLLDGRRAATHRMYAGEFARRFPRVRAVTGVRYIDDHPVYTAASTSAAIDLCLHLVRVDHGAAAADRIARELLLVPVSPGAGDQIAAPGLRRAQRLLSQDLGADVAEPARLKINSPALLPRPRGCSPGTYRNRNGPPSRE
jgi:transcriptional regulator GlxA family with amidase domain